MPSTFLSQQLGNESLLAFSGGNDLDSLCLRINNNLAFIVKRMLKQPQVHICCHYKLGLCKILYLAIWEGSHSLTFEIRHINVCDLGGVREARYLMTMFTLFNFNKFDLVLIPSCASRVQNNDLLRSEQRQNNLCVLIILYNHSVILTALLPKQSSRGHSVKHLWSCVKKVILSFLVIPQCLKW